MLVFFDDILIYSKPWEEHLRHIEEVLDILEKKNSMLRCQNVSLE